MNQGKRSEKAKFYAAKPIWPEGMETEKNITVGFRVCLDVSDPDNAVFRIAASSLYRTYVNGKFFCHGPARGPHGFYRIDEWDLSDVLVTGSNLIVIEVAGYNVNNYYTLDQPSFLQAEIIAGLEILASTAGEGTAFEAAILKERVQKAQRYSFQRTFSEVYRMQPGYDLWRKQITADLPKVSCSIVSEKNLIPRRVPCPRFSLRAPVWNVSCGEIRTNVSVESLWKPHYLAQISPSLKGFPEEELEVIPSIELQKTETISDHRIAEPFDYNTGIKLKENHYHILDFGTNLTGFLGAKIDCEKETRVFFVFDEVLSDGDVDFKRSYCASIISYELQPGTYEVESFEPYTLRYLKLIVLSGDCEVSQIYLREYANPDVFEAHFSSSDRDLNKIFEAGRETFRQNAVDIFTDCPSRERAGWLCDSFFTARVAFDLSGNTTVEKNFLENYLLPERFPHTPDGMLPMCYPADHNDGAFIPNWALWFIIQLEEYMARSGDREMVDALKPRILHLFDYFTPFKNEYGLLEKLEGWIFLEWSKANEFVQDVNYPTNMLYAAALEAAGRLYDLPQFVEEAEKIREVIRQQSFDGEFFVDNAVRKNGKLEVTRNRTEVCQYYAFFLDVASPDTHSELWTVLAEHFGPHRDENNAYPEIHMPNAFIGHYLRLELLSRYGLTPKLLEESSDYFLYMAERTGTLWENYDERASCNHGFASHIVHSLYRDILGIRHIDTQNRIITLCFSRLPLDWCEGRIPVAENAISLKWWQEGDKIHYRVSIPPGFLLKVENISDKEVVQHP